MNKINKVRTPRKRLGFERLAGDLVSDRRGKIG
jgi:hypothetical protein